MIIAVIVAVIILTDGFDQDGCQFSSLVLLFLLSFYPILFSVNVQQER